MRRLIILVGGALVGCSSSSDATPVAGDTGADEGAELPYVFAPPDATAGDAAAGQEVGEGLPDGSPSVDSGPDTPVNHPPSFTAITPVTLKQGHSTTIALAPNIADSEDDDAALVLSWSSVNVALADGPNHVLTVVAPTDWLGTETISVVVTDTGELTAKRDLVVTVEESVVDFPDVVDTTDAGGAPDTTSTTDTGGEPQPVCGEVTLSYKPGKAVNTVLLSGSFNAWGATVESAWPMADGNGDGTYEIVHVFAPGTYPYKFIVDGAWLADPTNPKTTTDGYGNSILEVGPCN
jgi:hypothetical protein